MYTKQLLKLNDIKSVKTEAKILPRSKQEYIQT